MQATNQTIVWIQIITQKIIQVQAMSQETNQRKVKLIQRALTPGQRQKAQVQKKVRQKRKAQSQRRVPQQKAKRNRKAKQNQKVLIQQKVKQKRKAQNRRRALQQTRAQAQKKVNQRNLPALVQSLLKKLQLHLILE